MSSEREGDFPGDGEEDGVRDDEVGGDGGGDGNGGGGGGRDTSGEETRTHIFFSRITAVINIISGSR